MSQRDYVPAEFRGLARLFRQRVMQADADYIAAVRRITAPLEQRLDRKPILSQRLIMDTVQRWRAIPTQYRLALDASVGSKRRLTVVEYRLSASTANNQEWENQEWEDGVAVLRLTLTTANGISIASAPHSVVSRHAIARWYERSGRRDDKSLVDDITALLMSGERDRVRCHSGMWLSSVVTAHGHGRAFRVRDVRTFLSADALVQVSA